MEIQRRPSFASSIYQLVLIAFIITQTVFMLLGFSLSFITSTLLFIIDIFYTIYKVFQNYYLTIIAFLMLLLLQKFKIRTDKFLGNVLRGITNGYLQCSLCGRENGDLNCKCCKKVYHEACLNENNPDGICANPGCQEKVFKQIPQDVFYLIKSHKKQALYVSIVFVIIGLYPSVRKACNYFGPAMDN